MTKSEHVSECMNIKGLDPQAVSLRNDDNAFSTDDIVCNETASSWQPGGKIHFPHTHDAYHSGADSIDTRGS